MAVRPLCRSRGVLHAQARMGHTTKRIQVVAGSRVARFVLIYLSSRPHRLAARTWPSQGQNTGSIPVGAIPTNLINVQVPRRTDEDERTASSPIVGPLD